MRYLNPTRLSLVLGVIALAFGAVACDDDLDTGDNSTAGTYAKFSAVVDDTGGTTLTGELHLGGLTSSKFVDMSENSLTGTVGSEKKELKEGMVEGVLSADFNEDEDGSKIKIAFARGDGMEDAPNSTATLPDAFELELAKTKYPRGGTIEFTWSDEKAEGRMDWSMKADVTKDAAGKELPACVEPASGKGIANEGKFTIAVDKNKQKVKKDEDGKELPDDGKSCAVTLTVERSLSGEVDKAFKFGQFTTTQRRVVKFTSVAPVPEGDAGAVSDAGADSGAPIGDASTAPDSGMDPVKTDSGTLLDASAADAGAADAGAADAGAADAG